MMNEHVVPRSRRIAALVSVVTLLGQLVFPAFVSAQGEHDSATVTPIKHVIVIVGENRTFDHIFATYQPKAGETVNNLLSEGIVNADGTPGLNYARAQQNSADVTGSPTYQPSPATKAAYSALPAPLSGGPRDVCAANGMCNYGDAVSTEDGLATSPVNFYDFLLTGGTGLPGHVPDSRISGVHSSAPYSTLKPGPFQITNGSMFLDSSYANSPVHRFYQMWQQEDCNVANATATNPSGCLADLFTWTEVTVGSNVNGKPQPANFSTDYAPGKVTTGEGATAMAFYNMQQGDAAYTKYHRHMNFSTARMNCRIASTASESSSSVGRKARFLIPMPPDNG